MIDNFNTIEQFMEFEQGSFYKFECLIRNTDGANSLYEEGMSKTNKNILVKSWYVDNAEYYQRIKKEMITMADLTGARIYVTLDRKSILKLTQNLMNAMTECLVNQVQGKQIGIKSLSKMFASNTSIVESSDKTKKTIMFDLDSKTDVEILEAVKSYIEEREQDVYILETKKGYHIFCYKKFNHLDWLDYVAKHCGYTKERVQEVLSVKANELGLVYHPMKG